MAGAATPIRLAGTARYRDLGSDRCLTVGLAVADGWLVLLRENGAELDRWPADAVRPMPPGPDDAVNDPAAEILRLSVDATAMAVLEVEDTELRAALARAVPGSAGPPHLPFRPYRIWAWATGALVSFLAIIFIVIPAFADTLARFVPERLQSRIGYQVVSVLTEALVEKGGQRNCKDPAGRAALDKLVAGLELPDAPPLILRVIETGHVNALAAPGGHVVILAGMIEFAGSPEALQGVIAHEVGHLVRGHSMKRILRVTMVSTAIGLLTGDFGLGITSALATQLLSADFTRDQEREADTYAVAALNAAGIPTGPMADMFDRLAGLMDHATHKEAEEEEADSGFFGVDVDLDPQAWFASHPDSRERAATIRAEAPPASAARAVVTEEEWQALRRVCGSIAKPRIGDQDEGPGEAADEARKEK